MLCKDIRVPPEEEEGRGGVGRLGGHDGERGRDEERTADGSL